MTEKKPIYVDEAKITANIKSSQRDKGITKTGKVDVTFYIVTDEGDREEVSRIVLDPYSASSIGMKLFEAGEVLIDEVNNESNDTEDKKFDYVG